MALAPLATVADVEARGVTVEPGDVGTLETFLAVASAAVRDAAGCPISRTTSTLDLEGPDTAWLTLPGPPVIAVGEVAIDGWVVLDHKFINGRLWRACGWHDSGTGLSIVTATYTHGFDPVPADIVDLVCRLALAGLAASQSGDLASSRVWQERIGDYFVMYRQDSGTTEMELTEGQRGRLRARFGGGTGLLTSR